MKFNAMSFLPLISKLGDYLKLGFDHYVSLKASGTQLTPDLLGTFICMKMVAWDPEIQGKKLLDDETRVAASRFLAGVIINMVSDKR
ncbi:MAG: hypothetical protein EBR83_10355 [Verrucomicrobia bacterium]|nr:hypothetical protein [Verrucomicrobiota bacterium]